MGLFEDERSSRRMHSFRAAHRRQFYYQATVIVLRETLVLGLLHHGLNSVVGWAVTPVASRV